LLFDLLNDAFSTALVICTLFYQDISNPGRVFEGVQNFRYLGVLIY